MSEGHAPERLRLNTLVIRGGSQTPMSFELGAGQSLQQVVDLCLKPHLASVFQQSASASTLLLWPVALYQQEPLFTQDMHDDPNPGQKMKQALHPANDREALSRLHVRQLLHPNWNAFSPLHLLVFVTENPNHNNNNNNQNSSSNGQGQQQQQQQSIPQKRQQPPAELPPAPPSSLPFLQYLSMPVSSNAGSLDHHLPYLQHMPSQPPSSSVPSYGLPVSQDLNANLDPVLAAFSATAQQHRMQQHSQPNGRPTHQSEPGDIHVGPSSSSREQPDYILTNPADDDDHDDYGHQRQSQQQSSTSGPPPAKRARTSQGSSKSDAPRHVCEERNEEGQACGASFARPYDLNRHKSSKHGIGGSVPQQELSCTVCARRFSRRDALLRHQRVKGHGAGAGRAPSPSSLLPGGGGGGSMSTAAVSSGGL